MAMRRFRFAALAAVAVVGFASVASAADMPMKAAPMVAPVAAYNWTGFYVGGDVGARWSSAQWTTLNFGNGNPAPSAVDNGVNLNKTSFRVGGYTGYNWMFAPAWLAGLEADIGWAGGTATHTPFPGASVFEAGTGTGTDFVNVKLGWDGSVRGRLGYLVAPNWLVYGTGGVAWQQINTSATCNGGGNSYCSLGVFSDSSTVTKVGWTVGGGVETMLWGNWIGRAQYRYADFGSVSNTFPPALATGFNASVRVRTNTAVLGLAYKFN
jgi:outer membrane immunogenic protein